MHICARSHGHVYAHAGLCHVRVCCRYVRSHLLSSDYEGCVTLWDVDTGVALNEYEAHDKRIWSVDYCTTDPLLFVSGSDDGFIKVSLLLLRAVLQAVRFGISCLPNGLTMNGTHARLHRYPMLCHSCWHLLHAKWLDGE